jgi:hypothetical protein
VLTASGCASPECGPHNWPAGGRRCVGSWLTARMQTAGGARFRVSVCICVKPAARSRSFDLLGIVDRGAPRRSWATRNSRERPPFSAVVDCIRAWLQRDRSRRIEVRWDENGVEHSVTMTGDAVDVESVREIARAAAHRVGGAAWPASTGPS